ncbi:protein disulfide-isomerase [Bacillus oleivorans]|uniref:Protein disulfide-isomerase n=1 Tax=Bacillus oleivorans TaxID=1448271 RepID=A0A285CNM2_9BACI|nr:DsbA family oxidoreductase [Bacillus oleivorans]SNX68583.1 protein disulfide-isomerase [Bacillus oleivorans]
MKIEVWSDFACPFCYIGKRRLEEALEQFPERDQVEVEFRSFELDPNAPKNSDDSLHEMLAKKYGTSVEQAKAMNNNVSEMANTVGLTYNLDQAVPTNTFTAHRLAQYAKTQGKEKEMVERLFKAYFTEGKHLSDHNTLLQLAAEVGLKLEDVKAVLESDEFTNEVHSNEIEAQQLGVTGVPFFVINRKYGISGAQPLEVFTQTLEKVWQEEQ